MQTIRFENKNTFIFMCSIDMTWSFRRKKPDVKITENSKWSSKLYFLPRDAL